MIKRMRIALTAFFLVVFVVFVYLKVTSRLDADSIAPEISADQDELSVSVTAEDSDFLSGMTAMDNRDGDVTSSLVVVSKTKFIRPGVLDVNYAAFDRHNNVGTYVRRITYTDYKSPEFSLEGPLVYRRSDNYPDYLSHVKASDVLDGNLTSVIRMSTSSEQMQEDGSGIVPLELQVTNTAGDVSTLNVEVRILDDKSYTQEAPALTQYLVYTNIGETFDPAVYVSGVRSGENERLFEDSFYTEANVTYDTSAVDWNTPGTYQIPYTLHIPAEQLEVDENGVPESDILGTTTMFVVVKES